MIQTEKKQKLYVELLTIPRKNEKKKEKKVLSQIRISCVQNKTNPKLFLTYIGRSCTEFKLLLLKLFHQVKYEKHTPYLHIVTYVVICQSSIYSCQDHMQSNLQKESEILTLACQTKFQTARIFPAACKECCRHFQLGHFNLRKQH